MCGGVRAGAAERPESVIFEGIMNRKGQNLRCPRQGSNLRSRFRKPMLGEQESPNPAVHVLIAAWTFLPVPRESLDWHRMCGCVRLCAGLISFGRRFDSYRGHHPDGRKNVEGKTNHEKSATPRQPERLPRLWGRSTNNACVSFDSRRSERDSLVRTRWWRRIYRRH